MPLARHMLVAVSEKGYIGGTAEFGKNRTLS